MKNEFFNKTTAIINGEIIPNYIYLRENINDFINNKSFFDMDRSYTVAFAGINFTMPEFYTIINSFNNEGFYSFLFNTCFFDDFYLNEISSCKLIFLNTTFRADVLHIDNTNYSEIEFFNAISEEKDNESIQIKIFGCESTEFIFNYNQISQLFISDCDNISMHCNNNETSCEYYFFKSILEDITYTECDIEYVIFENFSLKNLSIISCSDNDDSRILFIQSMNNFIYDVGLMDNDFKNMKVSFDDKINVYCFTLSNSSNINIGFLKVQNFVVRGAMNNVNFLNTRLAHISFVDFKSFGNVTFSNVLVVENIIKIEDVISSLSLNNSILKNVYISPSFLGDFQIINIFSSSIEGVEIYNFQEIKDSVIINGKSNPVDKIAFCRELVALMNKQNHKYYATNYNALEQDLRLEAGVYRTEADKWVLRLNSLSNGHGTRPEKALALIFICIFIYWWIFGYELHSHNYSRFDYSAFEIMANNLSVFFNPLKTIKDINYLNYVPSKWMIAFDIVYSIAYGYLVYQFIAAFRKFNRS